MGNVLHRESPAVVRAASNGRVGVKSREFSSNKASCGIMFCHMCVLRQASEPHCGASTKVPWLNSVKVFADAGWSLEELQRYQTPLGCASKRYKMRRRMCRTMSGPIGVCSLSALGRGLACISGLASSRSIPTLLDCIPHVGTDVLHFILFVRDFFLSSFLSRSIPCEMVAFSSSGEMVRTSSGRRVSQSIVTSGGRR